MDLRPAGRMFSMIKRFSLASPPPLRRCLPLSRSLLGCATLRGTNPQSSGETGRRVLRKKVQLALLSAEVWDGAAALVAHWSRDSTGWDLAGPKLYPLSQTGFQGKAAMRSGGRGRPRLRLGERGLLEPPSPPKRRLLPRAQLLPLLLLALAVASVLYTSWSGWHRQSEELPLGRELRVRPGGDAGTAGALIPRLPFAEVSG